MSTEEEAAAFANKIMETVGPAEALLMAMRLTLMVGQRAGEDRAVVDAAK